MKRTLIFILITILNILLFALLQITSVFVHFFVYGEGALGDRYSLRVPTFFMLFQLIILLMLFFRKAIIKTYTMLIINVLIVIGLYVYYNLWPEITV